MGTGFDPAPSIDDSRALAPIEVASQLVKIPEPELRSRAESAGLLILDQRRGAMIRLGDARMLARAPVDKEASPSGAPDESAPKKAKKWTRPRLAGPDDELIPTAELCALLGITRADLTLEQLHYFACRPPARLTRFGIGGGECVYVKADVDAWLRANPDAPGILRDRAKNRATRFR